MKKLFSIIAILFSISGFAQTLYVPNKPDSVKLAVNVNGAVRSVYVTDLIKSVYFSNVFTGLGTQASPLSISGITGSNLSSTIALPSGATATTQTLGDNSNKLATTAYSDAMADDNFPLAMQAIGSSVKEISVGMTFSQATTGLSLSDGILYMVPINVRKGGTRTGVKVVMNTAGSYTGDNENRVGLYSLSGGTLTLVASSANNATLWSAAAGLLTIPFASTVNVTRGLYYVGILYNNSAQTTAPSIFASTNYNSTVWTAIANDATNSNRLYGSRSSSTLLSTFAASTLAQPSSNIPLVMLY